MKEVMGRGGCEKAQRKVQNYLFKKWEEGCGEKGGGGEVKAVIGKGGFEM